MDIFHIVQNVTEYLVACELNNEFCNYLIVKKNTTS